MTQLMEHIEYLSKEIGARPAGTEEEQQAALYITEQIQKETGFTANIEEFNNSSNADVAKAALAAVVVVVTVLAIAFPMLAIPAFMLGLIAAAIYALEELDRPFLSRLLPGGASQNVVAKYQPVFEDAAANKRTRKLVLVAHYDTGRVTPTVISKIDSLGAPMPLVCLIGMAAAAFFLLVRIFIAPGGGMGLLVLNVLSILSAIVCALPVIKTILVRTAPFNEGAVNNASGSAALIEIARRISHGSLSEADLARQDDGTVHIHGEEAARAEGLIPEGVQVVYEAETTEDRIEAAPVDEFEEDAGSEEERLLSAKAAIAALTGKSVAPHIYSTLNDQPTESMEQMGEDPASMEVPAITSAETAGVVYNAAPAAVNVQTPAYMGQTDEGTDIEGFSNAPSWFVAAQQNARKAAGDESREPVAVKRSVYGEAFDYAERERAMREEQRRMEEQARYEAAMREHEEQVRRALELQAQQREQEALAAQESTSAADFAAYAADVPATGETLVEERYEEAPEIPADQNALPAIDLATEATEDYERVVPDVPDVIGVPGVIDVPEVGEEQGQQEEQGRLGSLPSIQSEGGVQETTSPSRSGLLRTIRANVPSLSGIINPVKAKDQSDAQPRRSVRPDLPSIDPAGSQEPIRQAPDSASIPSVVVAPSIGAPAAQPAAGDDASADQVNGEMAPVNSTIAMAPIDYNMELPADVAEEVAKARRDAQKSNQAQPHSEAPAVSVPRSRSGSLLDRFRRNRGEDLSDTPQEWLDVDDNFEARSVGRARGGWESFRDDQYDDDYADEFGSGDDEQHGRKWQGGAYSRDSLGRVNMKSGAESEADTPVSEEPELTADERSLTGEIEQIYHFRNPDFNGEIWFVAIGSDGLNHDGAKAFLDEHHDELRGSMIIEIESLGVGTLSTASSEGRVRKVNASSRVKRFSRNATTATGLALDSVSLVGTDSIASTVQKAGLQAMHLFGAEDGRPALKGSADDVLENIDEMLLEEHVNYVYELLKD